MDMFGWLGNMKISSVVIILVLSLFMLTGCSNTKESYYEIPKSEVVDVSTINKGDTDKPKNNEIIDEKDSKDFIYKNDRFGFSISIPDFLKPADESENGDGMYFENTNGDTYVSVYGSQYPSVNYDYPSLDEIYSEFLADMSYTPSFVDKGDNWYQVKWQEYNTIYVTKYYLKTDNTDNKLVISFPASKEKEYEDVVEEIINSFVTGIGYDSDCTE